MAPPAPRPLRKGICGGQHDEDLTSLFNPTFMDDLAVLVEGDTPESMLDKLHCPPGREGGL